MKDVNILTSNGVNVQQSLELFGDMELYDETLNDFIDMSQEKIDNLEKYKEAADMPNYAIAVHALKSDARYLGFLEFGDLCYDSEMKAKANDVEGVNANHPKVMEGVQKMLSVSRQYLGRTDGAAAPAAAPAPATPAPAPAPAPVATPTPEAAPAVAPAPVQPAPAPVAPQDPMMQQQMMYGGGMQPNMQGAYYDAATGQMVYPQGGPAPMPQMGANQGFDAMMGQQMAYGNQNMMYQNPGMAPQGNMMYQNPGMMNQGGYANHQMPSNLTPKQGTILVVDDSNLVANFVKKIFDSRYEVVIASDGAKAIELCKDADFRSKIKACLLDLNMPNVDGYAVLEDFKQNGYFVRMPVAVISGVEDMESIDKVNNYPIVDILAKPFNERDVQRVVEKCLATYF